MPESSYWSRFASQRRSRRGMLAAGVSGLAGAAALSLLGCGGGEGDNSGSSSQDRGLLTPLQDRSSEAKPGGRYTTIASNITQLDPIGSPSTLTRIALSIAFTRLFKIKPGVLEPSKGEVEGDLAEAWELANDGLQLTIKMRRNAGTDPRSPVNGRALDAQDVLASWKRWGEVSTLRFSVLNSLDKNAPIESLTAPDNYTLVFKFAFPSVITMDYLTDGFYFWTVPREAETYDPRLEAHGAGPYYVDEFVPGNRVTFKKNPNYYARPLPYIDEVQYFLLSEPAAQLAQFEAKAITDNGGVTTENIVDVFRRHPEMILYEDPIQGPGAMVRVGFSDDSPWRDIRLRRAASMSFNRADLAEYFLNATKLQAQGLPMTPLWSDHLSAMWPGVSLDPQDSKTYGPNAQYFHYNVEEAKKLVAAAGFSGKPVNLRYDQVSAAVQRNGTVFADQLRAAGWVVNEELVDRDAYYLPKVNRARGDFEGLFHENYAYQLTPESFIYSSFHPSSASSLVREGDFPELTNQINAITREFDSKKRVGMLQDFARRAAADMPGLPVGSLGPAYRLAWPWIAQLGVLKWWAGGAVAKNAEIIPRFWYDAAKAT